MRAIALTLAVLGSWIVGCNESDCTDRKCAPSTCVESVRANLMNPEVYDLSRDDVLDATEGTWIGDNLEVEVRVDSDEPLYGELDDQDVSDVARLDCAHMVVSAEVKVTSGADDDDGGSGESEIYRQIVVWGYEMAPDGSSPDDGLQVNFSGRYLGFPHLPGAGLHFGLDGTLWRIRSVEDIEQVGMRRVD